MSTGFLWGDENVLNLGYGDGVHISGYTKAIEVYTLNGWFHGMWIISNKEI